METQLVHKTVDFYGDELVAIEQDGIIYTPVKPICDILGIDWSSQRKRLERDEVLSEGMVILTVPTHGGAQQAVCLPADMLHG